MHGSNELLNHAVLQETRAELGEAFERILGYFFEDALTSLTAIERGMRDLNAVALVMPAHKLKSEARQFGAMKLGDLAEDIELFARRCVEMQIPPTDYIARCAAMRPLYTETLTALIAATGISGPADVIQAAAGPPAQNALRPRPYPPIRRPSGFGRRT